MNYKSMSDFEINKAVAVSLGFEVAQFSNINVGRQWCIKDFVADDWVPKRIPDYCNNPSDAWPIIINNNIAIAPCMGGNSGDATGYLEYKNPIAVGFCDNSHALRAAMIVFLMMNENK